MMMMVVTMMMMFVLMVIMVVMTTVMMMVMVLLVMLLLMMMMILMMTKIQCAITLNKCDLSVSPDVAPPVITCPASVTVNNDANSASARVTLPQPTATDNSGQPPTVANSAGGSAKDFTISGSPHTVRYTATDTTGNTKSCDIFVTVKGKHSA